MGGIKIIEDILKILSSDNRINLIYLFGSVLTERFNSESDIDIAIYHDGSISKEDFIKFKLSLINHFGRAIDLIDLNNVNLFISAEVIYNGKAIYIKNKKIKIEFEYKIAALYGQLKDDLKIVYDKITERGYVFKRDNFI